MRLSWSGPVLSLPAEMTEDTVTIPRSDLSTLLAAAVALTGSAPVPAMLPPLVAEVAARYKVRLEVIPGEAGQQ